MVQRGLPLRYVSREKALSVLLRNDFVVVAFSPLCFVFLFFSCSFVPGGCFLCRREPTQPAIFINLNWHDGLLFARFSARTMFALHRIELPRRPTEFLINIEYFNSGKLIFFFSIFFHFPFRRKFMPKWDSGQVEQLMGY